jgi:hypothetical protein
MYPEISPFFLIPAVGAGGVGTGVAAPYTGGAGDSATLPLLESNFESEGLSVRGGDVSPWNKGTEVDIVGCAAKYAANPEGCDGEVIARDAG